MTTVYIAPRAATFADALDHAAHRVRLAEAELVDAKKELGRADHMVREAALVLARCNAAVMKAKDRLCTLAATGRVDAYCARHDLFYTFEPGPDVKVDPNFRFSEAPPCPECEATFT